MRLQLRQTLFVGLAAIGLTSGAAAPIDEGSANNSAASLEEGAGCVCPEGYLPIEGGCCPACYFQTPPCLLPCFICEETCGKTGDVCDYSQGLTCCGGSDLCCPGGAQSTCSDFACAP
jgi:hypothetical protein